MYRLARVGGAVLASAGVAGTVATAVVSASDDCVHPGEYQWSHHGALASFDHAAIRRGFQVYREVCASCHSLKRICYRNLVGVIGPESEIKAYAEDQDVQDGPDDTGEMFDRPGKLTDPLPSPYPNDEAARAANNGALPPDLSLMCKARHGGPDYIFSLLTGFMDPPAGKALLPGLHYNPYFPGGAIGMEPPLAGPGMVEYEDGTEASISQMAKDVTVFLNWAAEPEHDDRKRLGFQWLIVLGAAIMLTGYWKRLRFSPIKTQKIGWMAGRMPKANKKSKGF